MPNPLGKKSDQTWAEGKNCLSLGLIDTATSRMYYAVFQAVKGFAVQRGSMTMDTPDGVHRKILEVVQGGGGIGRHYRRQLNELFGLRVIADYMPESVLKNDLEDLMEVADEIRMYHIRIAGGAS
jgi:uncharacterized protein (UPF0332 family)